MICMRRHVAVADEIQVTLGGQLFRIDPWMGLNPSLGLNSISTSIYNNINIGENIHLSTCTSYAPYKKRSIPGSINAPQITGHHIIVPRRLHSKATLPDGKDQFRLV